MRKSNHLPYRTYTTSTRLPCLPKVYLPHLTFLYLSLVLSNHYHLSHLQSGRGHNVRSAVVPDVVRPQSKPVCRRRAVVRLLPVRAAAVPRVRYGRHSTAPTGGSVRLRLRHGHATLFIIQGKLSTKR